ncbi:ML domain-containing protein [Halteromyces radiatus]|uniref:ML domain-containing protein n=1 Tax=Halteromyces radiatus TaxID=101107 RepID=UPI00221E59EB|nr:ML domain-containing protein [Halteromyces radiatus]KAI8080019.1 ML domain-containing protein [Halteromyces radiatus]
MKLLGITLLIVCLVQWVQALPSFHLQDQLGDFEEQTSTKLIQNCGDEDDLLTIEHINLTPDPPVKGQNLHIDFKGYLKETVEDGAYLYLTVKWGVVQLVKKELDLCEESGKIDEDCPIEKGPVSIVKDVELPKTIPGGKYTVEAEVYTVDGERVTCLKGVTTFPRRRL